MKSRFRRMLAAWAAVFVLSACQSSLSSDLPVGPAAYESIHATTRTTAPSGSYLLRAGDRVAISIYQEPELSQADLPIDEAGLLSLPLIGEIRAAGRSSAELADDIARAYGQRYLRDPKVNVALRESRPRTVAVEGKVTRPGVYPVEPGNGLLTAIATAGSPAPDAKLDEVLVFREVNGERMGGRFDLAAIRSGRAADPQVLPGDVIVVGYSALRGAYRDILTAAPLLGLFTVF